MPNTKLIDVVIPVYNAQATLASTMESVQRQSVREIGIVVVDDGSTDGSADLLEGIASSDSRIRIITTANGGIVDALNIGLAHADAEFIARFDADDIAFEDRLAKQLDFLRTNPRYVAVGGNAWHIDDRGNRVGTRSKFGGDVSPDPDWVPSKEPYLYHSFLTVRRDAVVRAGGYRHVFHAEDTDLYWRLIGLGDLYNLPDLMGEVRIHSNSVTGASIVNGRVSAVNSQLAAISAKRRKRGEEDLLFDKSMLKALQHQKQTVSMLAQWAPFLTLSERQYLDVAVAAKLLELATHRPYELEVEDCRFIRQALMGHTRLISPGNGARIGKTLARTLARLARTGHFREAAVLVGLDR